VLLAFARKTLGASIGLLGGILGSIAVMPIFKPVLRRPRDFVGT
jgi:hypothetical protein